MKTRNLHALALFVCLAFTGTTSYALEFATDDANTLEPEKYHLSFDFEYEHHSKHDDVFPGRTPKEKTLIEAKLMRGFREDLDGSVSIPFLFKSESTSSASGWGIGDITVDAKWRFYEQDGLRLAVSPKIGLPTGDDEDGFGAGKISWELRFIASKTFDQFDVSANLGYAQDRSESPLSSLRPEPASTIFGSLGVTHQYTDNLLLIGNLGVAKDTDVAKGEEKETRTFLLGGVVWKANEQISFNAGVKVGLSDDEADYGLLGGLALHF